LHTLLLIIIIIIIIISLSLLQIDSRSLRFRLCVSPVTDSWIGWHNDSGFLTALTSAMYFDDETGQIIENPDPDGSAIYASSCVPLLARASCIR
jgi:hypothetical protein